MAKAGLEMAIWDLYAKTNSKSLSAVIGGTRGKIASGVVVAAAYLSSCSKPNRKVS